VLIFDTTGIPRAFRHIWCFWRIISSFARRHSRQFLRQRRSDIFTDSTRLFRIRNYLSYI